MIFTTKNGAKVQLDTVKNKLIVLDFWTTTCGVCFKSFPDYEKIYLKYKDNSVFDEGILVNNFR